MKEEWIGLKYKERNLSDLFEVSNLGNIRRTESKKILKYHIKKNKYISINISCGSRKDMITLRLHTAVLESFCGINKDKPQVNHIDFNPSNNKLSNLEWCTASENIKHSYTKTESNRPKGEKRKGSKLKEKDVVFIKQNYIPRDKVFGGRALAKQFNVCHTVIQDVLLKLTWKHIA